MTIYRIAQETLANARQHAQATRTTLDISYEMDQIKLCVSDNGSGFDVRRPRARHHRCRWSRR